MAMPSTVPSVAAAPEPRPNPAPPLNPYDPYIPTAADPWDLPKVGHLLRRAALGPSVERVEAMLKLTPAEAVDSLLEFDPKQDPFSDLLDRMEGLFNFRELPDVQAWWFYRMLNTPRPAQERMALLWHNHFATSNSKVDNAKWMHGQIELFRQAGLGSFRDLLLGVTKDPAMLVWLDGQSNRKGHANENYAREVMELFTLGIGNYTERDVQQLARAFTGWQIAEGKAVLNPQTFDAGEKTIFGETGKFGAAEAVDLLLKQPAASKFIARRLVREFVHPDANDDHIGYYAKRLLDHDWQVKPVLREMLTSRLFYSDWSYRSRIKSPVDLAVGTAIAVGGKVQDDFLAKQTAKMGQNLLMPPNVKGWDGGEAWINANTVLVRFNFALALATGRRNEFARKPELEAFLAQHNLKAPGDIIDHYANRLLDGRLPPETKAKFVDFLNRGADGKPKPFVLNHATYNARVQDVMHLIMSMPEYQLG